VELGFSFLFLPARVAGVRPASQLHVTEDQSLAILAFITAFKCDSSQLSLLSGFAILADRRSMFRGSNAIRYGGESAWHVSAKKYCASKTIANQRR
jgi:hypothetical protein